MLEALRRFKVPPFFSDSSLTTTNVSTSLLINVLRQFGLLQKDDKAEAANGLDNCIGNMHTHGAVLEQSKNFYN